jgi:putative copper resistance protein D
MVVGKIVLFGCMLVLGAFNFLLAKRVGSGEIGVLERLRSFAGAESGIGFTIIFTAASITSQPPAVDLTVDRVSPQELVERMAPRWPPRWNTPPLSDLSPATPLNPVEAGEYGRLETYVPGTSIYIPSKPGDIAWSEYNHNWAGIIVLAVGILAMLARTQWPGTAWANHWPLAFLGLGVFLLLRADPENWPLGPRGFWESFQVAEVLQHRLFVVLIAIFACFEWSVRTGRLRSQRAAYAFPVMCALGGALLLTHSHSVGNIKEEMLQEAAHIPLAICGVLAGWSRWLELKLPPQDRIIPSRIWPVCFVLVGLILIFYRES